MARGFDSKSVEEQQAAYASKADGDGKVSLTPEEAARHRQRELLILSRKQVTAQLETATAERHRQMLEQALADLDRRIAEAKS